MLNGEQTVNFGPIAEVSPQGEDRHTRPPRRAEQLNSTLQYCDDGVGASLTASNGAPVIPPRPRSGIPLRASKAGPLVIPSNTCLIAPASTANCQP